MPQRMPRYTVNSRLLARQSETPVEVHEGLAAVGILENEFVPSTERPIIQNLSGWAIDRHSPKLLSFRRKDIQNVVLPIHVRPSK